MPRRLLQLVLALTVLGIGVGMLLLAALGSDGYSSLVNGLTITTGIPFSIVNFTVGAIFVGVAWIRGLKPGIGTIAQLVIVGVVVAYILDTVTTPEHVWAKATLLIAAFPILAVGIAGYLATDTGAGPAEAAALAFDPPLKFRWSYSVLQGGGAIGGWLLGADIGVGTIAVIFLLGPLVDLVTAKAPFLRPVVAQVAK